MTTSPKEQSEAIIRANKRAIDRSIRALIQEMESENTLVAESPLSRFQKVLKLYRGLKPVFAVLGTIPLIPSTWRTAIGMFDQALEALSGVGGDITARFKAGKDL